MTSSRWVQFNSKHDQREQDQERRERERDRTRQKQAVENYTSLACVLVVAQLMSAHISPGISCKITTKWPNLCNFPMVAHETLCSEASLFPFLPWAMPSTERYDMAMKFSFCTMHKPFDSQFPLPLDLRCFKLLNFWRQMASIRWWLSFEVFGLQAWLILGRIEIASRNSIFPCNFT